MASGTPTSPTTSNAFFRRRASSVSSVVQTVVAATERALDSELPPGFLAATADATSKAPTINEIRSGVLADPETISGGTRSRSNSRRVTRSSRQARDGSNREDGVQRTGTGLEPFPPLVEEPSRNSAQDKVPVVVREEKHAAIAQDEIKPLKHANKTYTSGYIPPPKLPWTTSTANALKGFWKWFLTIPGFLITLYGLNVVAWGGMLFLLLCNASPAMCWSPDPNNRGEKYFNCNDINSPRRKWIEWDSQILNALFCVTGFGLAPWRLRDLWYLLKYRLTSERKHGLEKKMYGLRKLAGYYKGWFRLPGQTTLDQLSSQEYLHGQQSSKDLEAAEPITADFDPRIPIPESKAPNAPLTGVRAPDTKVWKLDFFIWCQIWNTIFQCCLCYFMWAMNRIDRPSWSTGLFVALACGVAGIGGLVSFLEGKAVKRVEGHAPLIAVDVVREDGLAPEINETAMEVKVTK